ncbi:MAG: hypothetical protein JNJ50_03310 [Acidobacteria bacterium]|nr:hypothetical protein [Acidobacteriota bacterium]
MPESNQSLNPETIKLIVEVAAPVAEELVKCIIESQAKVQILLQKFDQLVLREINSAFDSLRDAEITENPETKLRRLNYAEDQLLRCTGLELNSQIGGYSSAYWVALAHFGLVTISKLDIGENGLLKPAFLAAFFAFDDKLFEFEDAASSD